MYGIARANARNKYGLFHKILITFLQDYGICIVVIILIQIWNNTYHSSSMWCVTLICGISVLIITLIRGISFAIDTQTGYKIFDFSKLCTAITTFNAPDQMEDLLWYFSLRM